ncbi:flagellar biosynthesis protein FlhA [Chromobacterium violaceum]|uniref:Flagellar biosynthesis protein FlhA n=2 Tax=Chromobacterium violaceum TaxID=536 RepID=A0A1R0MQG9_CHRVL|nr:flagellar biosynthesis protein FlhA [Chromobacterium violaceum]ATP29363.1 flagellar biosynthesis protein FlhA [Chromobacterium violaceum]ATP33270.1 flagellar biosynthesis protein FlhA [Chromobacterium violaceum]KJH68306.1 flagellar biosynthesis protein FlhA [Chromobacterium violaceum]KMN47843.1 flagellar biosynthesis protein FlhA [Chromobacterium violaceum]KMN86661.1 flagellar biosynthesis protein FlhA [Chromobacterium violaceum]
MNSLTKLLADIGRHKLAAPLFLLAILAMVMLPLPPLALDMLFTFNIVLAIIVILVSVSARRPLDFSVFPTIILATTLLRLSLNVASTRVVLLHGHEGTHAAGRVIEAFGNVVIGGNFVVGMVVFVILMIINFMVVTKGAERISEVSARFTLDALPGKQMAIDADLNAGLINQEQAQQRRRDIATEADFYGAMDGASKFVRGDAIAGILILIINLFGGVAIGALMHNLSMGDAFRQYALMTIGDGLVAQIPALLLSSAAAIIVTRINDEADMPQQVGSQMLASPTVLMSAAGMMLVLAIIPGMPWPTFLGFAALLGYVAWRMHARRPVAASTLNQAAVKSALQGESEIELEWSTLPYADTLGIALGYKLVALLDAGQGAPLTKRVKGVRQSLSEQMGLLLPTVNLRDDLRLKPSQYAIQISGNTVAEAEVYADRLMAIPSPDVYGEVDGIPGIDPAFGMPVTWIALADKSKALGLGYQVVDCASVMATHLNKVMRENLAELFRHDDVAALGERLAALAPKLAAALGQALTPVQQLRVFRQLLQDNVSLKDIVPIATALLEASDASKDPIMLAAEARCALKRQIVQAIIGPRDEIRAFNLSADLENLLLSALGQAQQTGKPQLDSFPIDPNVLQQLQANMPVVRDQMKQLGQAPVLLVMPQIRPLLARYGRLFAPGLHVLSYNEVPENRQVSLTGTLG